MPSPTPEEFIRLRAEGLSMEAIAERWHYASRQAVYHWVYRWRAAGLLDAYCRDSVNGGRKRAKNGRIVPAN